MLSLIASRRTNPLASWEDAFCCTIPRIIGLPCKNRSVDWFSLQAHFFDVELSESNLACRRTALDDAGGCDPLFGPGSYFNAEEMELLARISAKGWFGVYDPRPTVYHHHGRKTLDEARKLMSSYDYGRGAYYARCLMNRRLRMTYLKNWFWSLRGDVRGGRLRMANAGEIAAGMSFLVRHSLDGGRRFELIRSRDRMS